jgi:hypothetical protein
VPVGLPEDAVVSDLEAATPSLEEPRAELMPSDEDVWIAIVVVVHPRGPPGASECSEAAVALDPFEVVATRRTFGVRRRHERRADERADENGCNAPR